MNQYTYFALGIVLGISLAVYYFMNREEKIEKRIVLDQQIYSTPKLDKTMENVVDKINLKIKEFKRELTEEEKNEIIEDFREFINEIGRNTIFENDKEVVKIMITRIKEHIKRPALLETEQVFFTRTNFLKTYLKLFQVQNIL